MVRNMEGNTWEQKKIKMTRSLILQKVSGLDYRYSDQKKVRKQKKKFQEQEELKEENQLGIHQNDK